MIKFSKFNSNISNIGQKNINKAFSLIEISVVIFIIGLLIIGISEGINMAYEARVSAARSLTMNAPMKSIDGLELWLETTSRLSLSKDPNSVSSISNPEDDQAIGMWNDIKDQGTIKYNAVQSNSSYRPVFKKDGINKLPALYFDGVNDFIAYNLVAGETRIHALNNFVIFVVAFPLSPCVNRTKGYFGTSGQKYVIYPQHGSAIYSTIDSMAGAGISVCTNYINTVEHTGYYMPSKISYSVAINKPVQITLKYNKTDSSLISKLYVNSLNQSAVSNTTFSIFPGLSFGGGRPSSFSSYGEWYGYFKGYIGEIIIYSNELRESDRELIEKYLMDKWQINN